MCDGDPLFGIAARDACPDPLRVNQELMRFSMPYAKLRMVATGCVG
jgi:hypothetical protein